ncbi:MAG TPA: hypothetical protein DCY51_03500 [Bacteroidetes bacterium]|nr:hypothetical protein [Bacteroidota bacterium]
MKKKDKKISDFRWCIDNDFQVYVKPFDNYAGCNKFVVVVRKGGISSEGLDVLYKDGKTYKSKEIVGEKIYKNTKEASEAVVRLHSELRERYG